MKDLAQAVCLGSLIGFHYEVSKLSSKIGVSHSRILEFLDHPVGVELRAVLHVSNKRRRRGFLIKQLISQCHDPPSCFTHHSDPSPCSSALADSIEMVPVRPVLLLAVIRRSEIVDGANRGLDLGQMREQLLLCCGFHAG